ncbi:MAG TPA: hypothetical protein VG815_04305 [Chloroflexota bacterium]|nr:hypothetical protein [Chloroflexota bacterium]
MHLALPSTFKRSGMAIALAVAVLPAASGLVSVGSAQAAVGVCRSDPVVVLTNLRTMDISATVADSQSDLKSVSYTIHLPVGVRALLVVPTDGLVGQVEHFNSVSDQPANTYTVTTYAATGKTVPVTAAVLGVLSRSGSASGTSNENVTVHL